MDLRRREILLLAGAMLCLTDPAVSQQEKYIQVQREIPIPDSLKQLLSSKVDQARIQKNWTALKKGMLFKEVELLLGKPTKISSSAYDHSTTWYYGKRCVIFDNVKKVVRYWEEAE
jgi:outer membrane protein assembly factor BamE (lipoprotein component of BamABCDE complex)